LCRALLIARGDLMTFVTRPISAALLGIAAALLAIAMLPMVARKRNEVFVAGSDMSPSLAPYPPAQR
jgi:putative tricarboxylic transport membrane protein